MTVTAAEIDVTSIADRYIATWNETDAWQRRALIEQTWVEDGRYLDPMMSGEGHEGIDAMIAGVQARFPGFTFQRIGDVDAHNGCLRFSWVAGSEPGEAQVGGVDFGVLAGDRLQSITGFFDGSPDAE